MIHKASGEFRTLFEQERLGQYKSLMVVPIRAEGEIRALVRMMSTDTDCFLDRHAVVMQGLAFIAGYALAFLDSSQRRDRISESLSFFAKGQAVTDRPSLPSLLALACSVLGASSAVFWPVAGDQFGDGKLVALPADPDNPADKTVPACRKDQRGDWDGIRPDGLTKYIQDVADRRDGSTIFCQHVLADLKGQTEPGGVLPEYLLQVFAQNSIPSVKNGVRTEDGFYRYDFPSTAPLPVWNRCVDLSPALKAKRNYLHTQTGFAVKDQDGCTQGVVWLCWDDIHQPGWWERLFIDSLANYLQQSLQATGLALALRGFRHMLYNLGRGTEQELRRALNPTSLRMQGLPPADLRTAAAKAADLAYMVAHKCVEVKSLQETGRGRSEVFRNRPLSDILHRAWAIATDLFASTTSFAVEPDGDTVVERGAGLQIHYTNKAAPEMPVSEAVYTVALNVLQNMKSKGKKPPYVVWAYVESSKLHIFFGDGGGVVQDARQGEYDQGGTGLRISRQIMENVDGEMSDMLGPEAVAKLSNAPKVLREQCKVLFKMTIPHDTGDSHGNRSHRI